MLHSMERQRILINPSIPSFHIEHTFNIHPPTSNLHLNHRILPPLLPKPHLRLLPRSHGSIPAPMGELHRDEPAKCTVSQKIIHNQGGSCLAQAREQNKLTV
jgi:hypothetical protein